VIRENAKLVIIAVFCLVVGLSAPAVSATVQHALYADKAGKVDGRDAVGAGASTAQRSGKLVATSATTGRLPNNIIAKALDAAKLGGFTGAQLRTVTVPTGGMYVSAPAALDSTGITMPHQAGPPFPIIGGDLVVPDDHVTAHQIRADVIVYTNTATTCMVTLIPFGWIVTPGTTSLNGSLWFDESGQETAGRTLPNGYTRLTYLLDEAADPGDVVKLLLTRNIDVGTDNCGYVTVIGLQFRY
jgi:hypothetical protein